MPLPHPFPDLWEEEPYWLVEEALPALGQAGLQVDYDAGLCLCRGVYDPGVGGASHHTDRRIRLTGKRLSSRFLPSNQVRRTLM